MATIIQIKRSANVTAPTTSDLVEGELAYSYDKNNSGAGAKLYIEAIDSGNVPVIHAIGGKYYTDKVESATSSNTANTIVARNYLGNFTANTITATLSGVANSATRLQTTRFINITGDLSGTAAFDGTANADINLTIQPNTIALGTDTTGDYVSNILAGSGISVTNQGGENATPTIALTTTSVTPGTYGDGTNVPVITIDAYGRITAASNVSVTGGGAGSTNTFSRIAVSGQSNLDADGVTDTLTFANALGVVITTDASTDTVSFKLSNTGVSAATYGNASSLGVITVDEQGRITSASNVNISIPASALSTNVELGTQTTGAYVANLVAGPGIALTGLGNEGTTPTIINLGVTSISGTTNQIDASASVSAVTLSLPSSIITPGDLTVTGNLIINGTATTLNTVNLEVKDPLVRFGSINPSDILDIGFFGPYTSGGTKYAGLFRDASDSGIFKFFKDLTTDPTTNVIDTTSLTIASLVANLTGGTVSNLLSSINVSDGGTGRGTLTTNAVLYGQGTSAVGLATGTAGQLLQLDNSGIPVFAGLDGGTY